MCNKLDLIVFPMHDWKKCEKEGFRTRDAHLVLKMAESSKVNKILFVDRPISIAEMLIKKRRWRVSSGEVISRKRDKCLTRVGNKIFVLDILVYSIFRPLLLRRAWWSFIFTDRRIITSIKEAQQHLKMINPVLFIWSPLSFGVINKLDESLVVFDALDNWARHPEMTDARDEILRGYNVITKRADLIFANSVALRSFFAKRKREVILIPNGVDIDFFDVKSKNSIPKDLQNLKKPIVGYAGKIAKRIDVSLLSYLASNMPKVNFVLVGPILNSAWIKPLKKQKNIFFLKDKNYQELPSYLARFDICIIPHNVGNLENDGDPIKLYEYLAMGKPVVSTNIAGMNNFRKQITIAHSKEEFQEGIEKYLNMPEKEKNVLAQFIRKSIPPSFSWSHKAESMIDRIIGLERKVRKESAL